MTSGTFGLTSRRQFAVYDRVTSSWRTWPAIGLWGSTPFSGTWPKHGMTSAGAAFELRMSAPRMGGSGSSSLLATPTASIAKGGRPQDSHGKRDLRLDLLPTPRTSDANGGGKHGDGGPDLRTVAALLPTPTSRDHKGQNQRSDASCLTGALLPTPSVADAEGTHERRGGARSDELLLPGIAKSIGEATGQRSADGKAS